VRRKKSWNKITASELGRVLWFEQRSSGYELTLHRFRKSVKGFAEPWPWPSSKERTTYANRGRHMNLQQWRIGEPAGYAEPRPSRDAALAAWLRPWYLVQISEDFDRADADFLHRMQIEVYRPLIRFLKPVPRNTLSKAQRRLGIRPMREKIEPFFPGYAFVNFEHSGERWREIFRMARIRGLACANNRPLLVPWSLIEEISAREVDGAIPGSMPVADMAFLSGASGIGSGRLRSFNAASSALLGAPVSGDGELSIDQLDGPSRMKLLVGNFGQQLPLEMTVANFHKL
jgi:transcription antitermination factor NusG